MAKQRAKSHRKASLFHWLRPAKKQEEAPRLSHPYRVQQVQYVGQVSNQGHSFEQIDHQEHLILCREAFFQNNHARIYINRQVSMIVNDGLTLQFNPLWSHIDTHTDFKEQQAKQIEVQERWYLWASSLACMLTGDMNFHVAQHELYKMLLRDGEFFILLHRQYDTNLVNPLRLQIVATDALPYDLAGDFVADATARGNYIDHGIEFNSHGQPVAYYFMQQDRSMKRIPTYAPDGRRWVLHVKRGDYLGSSRGVSDLVNHLPTLAKIRDFEQNELTASKLNAQIAAYVRPSQDRVTQTNIMFGADEDEDDTRQKDSHVIPNIPGMVVQQMAAGEDLLPFGANSIRPSSNVVDFVSSQSEAMMVSAGMPMSVARLHMNKSYSASRAELALFETFRKHRIEDFSSKFLNVIFEQWLHEEVIYNDLLLIGYSHPKKRKYFMNVTWHPDPIPNLDPLKSAKAMEILIANGITTHEQATRDHNDGNWDDNIEHLAREMQKMQDLGLFAKSTPSEVSAKKEDNEEEKNE
ncbi:phage portal protein (plasmid) [Entomospira nematocerorum]|uniref:Phage portal protein n=1 Tax=Entomospira nematocerorum TaxID=2719987 RepID=A0A968GDE4_9SPIO|nr:phage portal protein [Entomospira nematocera]NIZ47765.1 phage portal protein [Entomospira nematocera]WDI34719.1 phage portal protein [Entomospira nematocera]